MVYRQAVFNRLAVKLVVEREREIRAFIPEEYWQVLQIPFQERRNSSGGAVKQAGKTLNLKIKPETDALLNVLKTQNIKLHYVRINRLKLIQVPHISTSTLQQAASTRLGFLCEENHDAGAAFV